MPHPFGNQRHPIEVHLVYFLYAGDGLFFVVHGQHTKCLVLFLVETDFTSVNLQNKQHTC